MITQTLGIVYRAISGHLIRKAFDPAVEESIHGLLGHSITYRIATGPREGQKVFLLQVMPRIHFGRSTSFAVNPCF